MIKLYLSGRNDSIYISDRNDNGLLSDHIKRIK